MKKVKIATPIFLVREKAEKDIFSVIRSLGKLGFDAFELVGLYGKDPEDIRRAAEEEGLEILMDHVPYAEFVLDLDNVIATRKALGLTRIAISRIPDDYYPGGIHADEGISTITRIAEKTKKAGITLQYHNHGDDFMKRIDGKYPIEILLDSISPELLQHVPDIGWCLLGGGDPVYMMKKYRDRCNVIHMKDYYAEGPVRLARAQDLAGAKGGKEYYNFEFRPTGYGIVDFASMMNTILDCNPEWITTDHDASYYDNDYYELVISRQYVENIFSIHRR